MEVLNKETFKSKVFDFESEEEWKFIGKKPAVIDFYADWCQPCHMLIPVLERIEDQYADRLEIYKVDTEASPELAAIFQIRSLPSILFVPLEGEPALNPGFIPEESFKQALSDILGL